MSDIRRIAAQISETGEDENGPRLALFEISTVTYVLAKEGESTDLVKRIAKKSLSTKAEDLDIRKVKSVASVRKTHPEWLESLPWLTPSLEKELKEPFDNVEVCLEIIEEQGPTK